MEFEELKRVRTLEVELVWKSQWRGDVVFSHGSEHSRSVMILVKENFDCELKVCHTDSNGRFIILSGQMQDHLFVLINIYAPNRANDQCTFSEETQMRRDEFEIFTSGEIIIGGDFNVILDCDRDGSRGKPKISVHHLTKLIFGESEIQNPNLLHGSKISH